MINTDPADPTCNGICLSTWDIGVPEAGYGIAYPHPECPAHGYGEQKPMSNFEKANETIYRVLNPQYGDFAVPTDAAQALADAGLIADDLPEPSLYAYGDRNKPMWDTANHFRTDALDAPQVALSKAGELWKMTPANARALARALLAAADHAEGNN